MVSTRPASRSRIISLSAVLLIIGLGCLCTPSGLLPTPSPLPQMPTLAPPPTLIQPPTLPQPPTPLVRPTRTPQSTPTPFIPVSQLSPSGPWLLIETNQGLWAVNTDGSGLTRLTDVDYWHGDIQDAIQPGGNEIAYLTPGNMDLHHLALNLMALPQGNTSRLIELTSSQTEAFADSGPGDPGFEALRAIGEQRSFAWSPDGSKLAFMGAMSGLTADAYIFDSQAMNIKRISEDPGQDFWPSWSPGGSHLLFFEAENFGTGAGMVESGVWDYPIHARGPSLLYKPTGSGELIAGWLNDTTVVLASSNMTCGPEKLRLYDVVSKQETLLNEGCFTSASATGFRSGVLFSNDRGIFLLTDETRTPMRVSNEKNAYISRWGPDDYAFKVTFSDGRAATFGPGTYDVQVSPVIEPSSTALLYDEQDVAMYGAIWGWTSTNEKQPGVWITGPGLDIGRIFDSPARFPAWSPNNNLLFFAPLEGGYDLYLTTFDSHYTDLRVVNHLDADITGVVWLGPR